MALKACLLHDFAALVPILFNMPQDVTAWVRVVSFTIIPSWLQSIVTSAWCYCRNYVLLEDVEYFLDKPKAKECFEMLDLDKDGKVSLKVCCYPLHALPAVLCVWILTHSNVANPAWHQVVWLLLLLTGCFAWLYVRCRKKGLLCPDQLLEAPSGFHPLIFPYMLLVLLTTSVSNLWFVSNSKWPAEDKAQGLQLIHVAVADSHFSHPLACQWHPYRLNFWQPFKAFHVIGNEKTEPFSVNFTTCDIATLLRTHTWHARSNAASAQDVAA